jgi:hypothetical protein
MSDEKSPAKMAPTKRKIKRDYLRAYLDLSDAIPELMFNHEMMYGEALRYLMKNPVSAQQSGPSSTAASPVKQPVSPMRHAHYGSRGGA